MTGRALAWRLRRSLRSRLASQLQEAGARLGRLSQSTEKDFLEVGGTLEAIVKRARQEAGKLSGLSSSLASGQGTELASALEQVRVWTGQAGETASCELLLTGLLPLAKAVTAPVSHLRSAVRTLQVMGVLTRVESARLGCEAAGFESLSSEVTGLGATIQEKSDAIAQAIDNLVGLIESSIGTAAKLEKAQNAELTRLVGECAAGLDELNVSRERLEEVSRAAQDTYQRAVARVSEMVVGLQSHDSTRQRLGHVEEALAGLASSLISGTVPHPSDALDTVELQTAQIVEARRASLDAIARILTGLEALAGEVAGLAASARQLSEGANSYASGVEGRFTMIAGAIGQWTDARRQVAAMAIEANQSCARMSDFAGEIESVGVRLLHLSLNAEVQAARLSKNGAVVETVAEGIRFVSRQASFDAAEVTDALRRAEAAVTQLSSETGETGVSASRRAEGLNARIRQLTAGLRTSVSEHQDVIAALAGGADNLSREIGHLASCITAHRSLDEVSSACLETMAAVAGAARSAAGTPAGKRALFRKHAGENYTMRAEREVHESFAGEKPSPDTDSAAAAISEFGSNVELF
ncbi:MAG TPA: hypothetical protein VMH81_04725 [Bryobacteraceae bacterium]|nr:hypothetical protein [Bryobacteraceae bacterium]